MRKLVLALLATVVAAGLLAAAAADSFRPPAQVFDKAAEPGTLEVKLARVLTEASKSQPGQAFWVGYDIDRLQGENSHIGSYSDGWRGRRLSIADILAGKREPSAAEPAAGDIRAAAKAALDNIEKQAKPEKQVVRELGFFLKYEPGRSPVLAKVGMSDLDLSFDFEGAPLYWLGKAPEESSIKLIAALYGQNAGEKVREGLIAAAGCHGAPKLVLPFLQGILDGNDPDKLRKDATFWISQQNDPAGLGLLAKAARSDRSREVREGAVFGIGQVELPAAADELIVLAKSADKKDVRKQAVFWLSQMASSKSGHALEEIAVKDEDLEIQEQAVFALSQLPSNQGLDALIKLARTHPDPRIRKKAVFWLGECDDPRALDAIIAIIKGK
jgi:HEAT repeat protein